MIEVTLTHKTGQIVFLYISIHCTRNTNRNTDKYVGTATNMSKRKKEIDDILSHPMERGIVDAGGDPFYGPMEKGLRQ